MSITPEQFGMLVTKNEHNELKEEIVEVKQDVKKILSLVDVIANNTEVQESEKTANIDAHDRFNDNFYKIKEHLKLKSIEAVKQL